jgi:hypothetical protein
MSEISMPSVEVIVRTHESGAPVIYANLGDISLSLRSVADDCVAVNPEAAALVGEIAAAFDRWRRKAAGMVGN